MGRVTRFIISKSHTNIPLQLSFWLEQNMFVLSITNSILKIVIYIDLHVKKSQLYASIMWSKMKEQKSTTRERELNKFEPTWSKMNFATIFIALDN